MSGIPGQRSRMSEMKSPRWEQRWCHSGEKKRPASKDWQSWPRTCRSFFWSAFSLRGDFWFWSAGSPWQVVKKQSWQKRREMSKKIQETDSKIRTRERDDHSSTETVESLQDHLKQEMEEHIRGHYQGSNICMIGVWDNRVWLFFSLPEGRGAAENIQGRVGRIQQLVEALREERVKMEAATGKADICQHVTRESYIPARGSDEDLCAKSQNFIKIFDCLSLL